MNTRALLKSLIDGRSPAMKFAIWVYNRLHLGNSCSIKKLGGNTYKASLVLSKGTRVKIKGKHNEILISPGTRLNSCRIFIFGDNNRVTVGEYCTLNNVEIWIEDSNNEVHIGELQALPEQRISPASRARESASARIACFLPT